MDLQQLNEIVKAFDQTGIGRCLTILATLAEIGLDKTGEITEEPDDSMDSDDPLWSPTKTANYLDVSVATLRTYRKRYHMKSCGNGKARRYRRSEVERIVKIREGVVV